MSSIKGMPKIPRVSMLTPILKGDDTSKLGVLAGHKNTKGKADNWTAFVNMYWEAYQYFNGAGFDSVADLEVALKSFCQAGTSGRTNPGAAIATRMDVESFIREAFHNTSTTTKAFKVDGNCIDNVYVTIRKVP